MAKAPTTTDPNIKMVDNPLAPELYASGATGFLFPTA